MDQEIDWEWFTGTVRIESPFKKSDSAKVSGAIVTFEFGARSAWHTHSLGQTLNVTAGAGACSVGADRSKKFDRVMSSSFPPGAKHWYGASPSTAITHIAIAEALDRKVVDWMKKVSEEQYQP